MGKEFDFRKLIDMDPAAKDDLLRDEIYDQFERVNARLAPMIWSLAWAEMEAAKSDSIKLNAVINSLVSAVTLFLAGSIDDPDFLNELCEKIALNLRNCYSDRQQVREIIGVAAPGIGRALLLENAMPGIKGLIGQCSTGLGAVAQGIAAVSTQLDGLKKA